MGCRARSHAGASIPGTKVLRGPEPAKWQPEPIDAPMVVHMSTLVDMQLVEVVAASQRNQDCQLHGADKIWSIQMNKDIAN